MTDQQAKDSTFCELKTCLYQVLDWYPMDGKLRLLVYETISFRYNTVAVACDPLSICAAVEKMLRFTGFVQWHRPSYELAEIVNRFDLQHGQVVKSE
jgi:hypothetical protein